MSLDKAIEHKKEKRKPYKGGAKVSSRCRHGGDCTYCQSNRQYRNKKREQEAEFKLKDD